jgi:hypothetical protein
MTGLFYSNEMKMIRRVLVDTLKLEIQPAVLNRRTAHTEHLKTLLKVQLAHIPIERQNKGTNGHLEH